MHESSQRDLAEDVLLVSAPALTPDVLTWLPRAGQHACSILLARRGGCSAQTGANSTGSALTSCQGRQTYPDMDTLRGADVDATRSHRSKHQISTCHVTSNTAAPPVP
jgi:hypothetical protein